MKKIIQLTTLMFLFVNFIAQADVQFSLTNQSPSLISVCTYADGYALQTLDPNRFRDSISCEIDIAPGDNLSQAIPEGEVELTITINEPTSQRKKFVKYITQRTANNKDKILIWNHIKSSKEPLFPSTEKGFLGFGKKQLSNNITQKELNCVQKNM